MKGAAASQHTVFRGEPGLEPRHHALDHHETCPFGRDAASLIRFSQRSFSFRAFARFTSFTGCRPCAVLSSSH